MAVFFTAIKTDLICVNKNCNMHFTILAHDPNTMKFLYNSPHGYVGLWRQEEVAFDVVPKFCCTAFRCNG
jgi:hypothetical protein